MADALIGSSGFVGSTLSRQRRFDASYRSTNIAEIAGRSFDLVICAGAPAQKWLAAKDPAGDLANLESLMGRLGRISCRKFVLISTVDVFPDPVAVDEDTAPGQGDPHPYGVHRRRLEAFVEQRFKDHLIVRLPGLVGPGLKKNVLFDFLNDNRLEAIDSRGVFQFYPMVNLWSDLEIAMGSGLRLVHLTAAPVSVAEAAKAAFGREFSHTLPGKAACYDFRSKHAALWGGSGAYQYDKRAVLLAMRAYVQSEPRAAGGGRP